MAKLTLSLDSKIIHRAKRFAHSRGTSISRIVETYLDTVSSRLQDAKQSAQPEAPVLRSVRGILKGVRLRDYKRYRDTKYR